MSRGSYDPNAPLGIRTQIFQLRRLVPYPLDQRRLFSIVCPYCMTISAYYFAFCNFIYNFFFISITKNLSYIACFFIFWQVVPLHSCEMKRIFTIRARFIFYSIIPFGYLALIIFCSCFVPFFVFWILIILFIVFFFAGGAPRLVFSSVLLFTFSTNSHIYYIWEFLIFIVG